MCNIPRADISEEAAKLEPGTRSVEVVKRDGSDEKVLSIDLDNGSQAYVHIGDGVSKRPGSCAVGTPVTNGFAFH